MPGMGEGKSPLIPHLSNSPHLNVPSVSCWDLDWDREPGLDAHEVVSISQYEWGKLDLPVSSNSSCIHFGEDFSFSTP